MSSSVNSVIGPFVRIKLQSTLRDIKIMCCGDVQCDNYKIPNKNNFCTNCGEAISPLDQQERVTLGWNEFISQDDYEYEDELYVIDVGNSDEQILLSNWRRLYDDLDDAGLVSFGGFGTDLVVPKQEQYERGFHEKHKIMISKMREYFGDKMTIEYGAMYYWS